MNKKIIYSAILGFGLATSFTACSDFGDTNVNPEAMSPEVMDYRLVFTNVQQYCYGTEYEAWRNGLIYVGCMLQHIASTEDYWSGDKYTYNGGYNSAFWDRMYPNGIRDVIDLMYNWKDNSEYQAEYQMARIMKVLLFHRMTDMYGDCPYTEAGMGYYESNGYPKYDTQEFIYKDLLKELDEAATALSGISTSKIGAADLIYGGNIAAWRKFSYSLMLRLSMRLTKIDEATAKTYAAKAVAGGLFQSNEDNARIQHEGASTGNNSCEPFGKIYCHEDPGAYRMNETFVNLLKNSNDPRLNWICTVVPDPSKKIGSGEWVMGDTTKVSQLGMPSGYDTNNQATDISKAPNWPGSKDKYSVVNRYTYARINAPTFILTHAENQLLLAEAAYRGYVSGDAKSYYESGVRAAMEQFAQFGVSGISSERIEQYLKAHPYNQATALEQINTQYYINTFSDEYETFANWRRSGYPVLKPVNYIGNITNGTIPRRFTYPSDEATINKDHYLQAVGNLKDGDTMTSRVWWDKE